MRLWGSAISEGINPIIMDPNTEDLLSIVDNERRINVTPLDLLRISKRKVFLLP